MFELLPDRNLLYLLEKTFSNLRAGRSLRQARPIRSSSEESCLLTNQDANR